MRAGRRDPRDSSRDLLVSGHVNLDRFLRLDRFPRSDRTAPVRSTRLELGGTATNLALAASRAGLRTGLVARVGPEFPVAFRRRLLRAGIDLRGLASVRGATTPTCYILEAEDGAQRTLIDQGAMAKADRAPLPGPWLREYAWLHLATGDPAFQLRLASLARRLGVRVAADPAQEIFFRWAPGPFRELLARAEILFGNWAEVARAAELAGGGGIRRLLERVPLVVRTEGPEGAVAYSRTGRTNARARRPRSIRTLVGAGDAFRAGFYHGWLGGEPLDVCLTEGAATASRWIEGER